MAATSYLARMVTDPTYQATYRQGHYVDDGELKESGSIPKHALLRHQLMCQDNFYKDTLDTTMRTGEEVRSLESTARNMFY